LASPSFQQPLDYDTNANSVVRMTAGEVRRRLTQYHVKAAPDDEPIIELPQGSCVPGFHFQEDNEVAVAAPSVLEITAAWHRSDSAFSEHARTSERVLEHRPTQLEKGNYEIVLSSDQVNGLANPPKVIAVYFWLTGAVCLA
jgi:hypothetical protein